MPEVRPNQQPDGNRSNQLLRFAERIATNTELAAIRQKEWLSLSDVVWLLGTSDTTLRKDGFLNDLNKHATDPKKLNGFRLSKSPKAQWRFHRAEFARFGPTLYGGNVDHESSGDGAIDIRGA